MQATLNLIPSPHHHKEPPQEQEPVQDISPMQEIKPVQKREPYQRKTYQWYAQELGCSEEVARKNGKKYCAYILKFHPKKQKSTKLSNSDSSHKDGDLLGLQGLQGMQGLQMDLSLLDKIQRNPQLFDHEMFDEQTRINATVLLHKMFAIFHDISDNPELTAYQRYQIMIKLTRVILGGGKNEPS